MNEEVIRILLEKGVLNAQNAAIVRDLIARGKTLEQALVGGRYVSDKDYGQAIAQVLGLDYLDLENATIPPEMFQLLPEDMIHSYHILPIKTEQDGTIVYAMQNPRDIRADEAMRFYTAGLGIKTKQVVVPSSQIQRFLKGGGVGTELNEFVAQIGSKEREKENESKKEVKGLQEVIKGAPVARMLTTIMRNAVEQRASDIHIEPLGDECRIRYRIDGVLRTVLTLPVSILPALVARVKVLSNMKLDETRVPQDGRIRQTYQEKKIDFRISTLPVVDNEKVVLRILDTTKGAPSLEQLGFRKQHVTTVMEEIRKSHGMFLVTGPTGSGKSTTLFACLNLLNNDGVNISTLEDPVEYYIQGVNQSQIKPQIDYTFATGLRSMLRQDPNVIMVGEIRDRETAELAVHASLTGHLMFSTLHTNDAFGIVPRLIDIGVEPFLLAVTLNVGVAQRLARKICEFCKEPEEIDAVVLSKLIQELKDIPESYIEPGLSREQPVFYHGKGCTRCRQTGYMGRIAIAEVFLFTANGRKLVEKGFPITEVQVEAKNQGMITIRQDALLKALEGSTSIEEVFRLSQETEEGETVDTKS
ncbi:MAG: ATPase, T2SS/T4P/T4SS family [Patescibacteria group bacterium]